MAIKKLPEFKSEEEELAFWDEVDPSDYIAGPADVVLRLKKRPKRPVTFRLDEPLLDALKALAKTHGIGYQTLMRELLRQSVEQLSPPAVKKKPTPIAEPPTGS